MISAHESLDDFGKKIPIYPTKNIIEKWLLLSSNIGVINTSYNILKGVHTLSISSQEKFCCTFDNVQDFGNFEEALSQSNCNCSVNGTVYLP